jgi:hypothetical protein
MAWYRNTTQRTAIASHRTPSQHSASHRIASILFVCVAHRFVWHGTTPHCSTSQLHRIASHRITLQLHHIVSHRIASHRIASHRIASLCVRSASLHMAWYCTAPHRTAPHRTAPQLHRIASHINVSRCEIILPQLPRRPTKNHYFES